MKKQHGKTIEIIIPEIDLQVIEQVKKLRKSHSISQERLSILIGRAEGFVSKVENLTERAKYNIHHLALIANALSCSVWDLLPKMPPKNDLVRIRLRRNNQIKKDGTLSARMQVEVIEMTPVPDGVRSGSGDTK